MIKGIKFVSVRTRAEPLTMVDPVRRAVLSLDPLIAPTDVETLEQRFAKSLAPERLNLALIAIFAAVALALAAVGLYGLISYLVSQRTRELGVRMALGAQRHDVLGLVLRRGVSLALYGTGIGVLGAVVVGRGLERFLFGVSTTDPLTVGAVTVLLLVVAVGALVLPARRAAGLDPVEALRD